MQSHITWKTVRTSECAYAHQTESHQTYCDAQSGIHAAEVTIGWPNLISPNLVEGRQHWAMMLS
jgi:hypothetical protein